MIPHAHIRPAVAAAALALLASCAGKANLKREASAIAHRASTPASGVRTATVQQICWELAKSNLRYSFGSCRPENGGLDCSGTIHYVLSRAGYQNVPRQSNHQYFWLKEAGTIHHAGNLSDAVLRRLRPGDLMFWKGTYRTGKRWPNISHVMIYMGRNPQTGGHYMFGGRSGGQRGLNGSGIDFYPLRSGESEGRHGSFVGYGRPPGMR